MMVRMAPARTHRWASRYGLAAVLILAAALWPPHSDAFLVGAGILLGLSMAVRLNSRGPGGALPPGHSALDARPSLHCLVTHRTGARLWPGHRARRNELTGELLERSRLRMTAPGGRKRAHDRSPARSARAPAGSGVVGIVQLDKDRLLAG